MRPRFLLTLLLLLPSLATAAVFKVTNTNDAGPGSLRAALESARDDDRIEFRIAGPVPASGWFTIRPQSLYPHLKFDRVTIDGTTQPDTNPHGPEIEIDGSEAGFGPGLKFVDANATKVLDLAINHFGGNGIVVERGSVDVLGNYVGVDPAGTAARPNGSNGVLFIGAAGAIWGNVISGNAGNGIFLLNSNVEIAGNRIGGGRTTQFAVPNGANGVHVSTYVTRIDSNIITFNRDHGITLAPNAGMITITRNQIWSNGYLSIDLGHDGVDVDDVLDTDRGANGKMNAPKLISARVGDAERVAARIRGEIRTVPRHEVIINFYAAPHRSELGLGETQVYLGYLRTVTNGDGFAEFTFDSRDWTSQFIPGGYVVATAFAGGAREGTSELSAPIPLETMGRVFEVTTVADSGSGSLRAAIEAANATECTRDEPCRISFRVPDEQLQDRVAVIEPLSPLPAIARDFVYLEGGSQEYWSRHVTPGPEVEIRGTSAGADAIGLRVGSASAPVTNVGVHDVAIRGFAGEGLVLHQRREKWLAQVSLRNIEVTSNDRDGLVMFGGSGTEAWNQFMAQTVSGIGIVASDNRGHGIVLHDDANHIINVRAMRNAGDGVFVRGSNSRVEGGTVAQNGGAGVASANEARAVYVDVQTFANGSLGIDRKNDGATPNDGAEADGILDAPELLSARWDPATKRTVVRGRATQKLPMLPQRQIWSHRTVSLRFYANAQPDDEGEKRITAADWIYWDFNGEEFEIPLQADLRGQWVTATRSFSLCFWEYGCGGADTSEFSGAVKVE